MQEKITLNKIIDIESKIKGILETLYMVEMSEGIKSPKFKSLCRLLNDFLVDEEQSFELFSLNKGHFNSTIKLLKSMKFNISDEILSFFDFDSMIEFYNSNEFNKPFSTLNGYDAFFKENAAQLIKIFKILSRYISKQSSDFFNCKLDLKFLSKSNNPKLKYKFAFINPEVCSYLTTNYFDLSNVKTSMYNNYFSNNGDNGQKRKKQYYEYLSDRISTFEIIISSPNFFINKNIDFFIMVEEFIKCIKNEVARIELDLKHNHDDNSSGVRVLKRRKI